MFVHGSYFVSGFSIRKFFGFGHAIFFLLSHVSVDFVSNDGWMCEFDQFRYCDYFCKPQTFSVHLRIYLRQLISRTQSRLCLISSICDFSLKCLGDLLKSVEAILFL